jgi:NhaA family Na+:H+ antiporter
MDNQAAPKSHSALRAFLSGEAAGGIILMAVAALAILIANSPLGTVYAHVLHMPFGPTLSSKLGPMTAHLWINDALMAVFFLLVGLEIKRELVDGRLATWPQRRLPVLAAAAGMAVPALLYLFITRERPDLASGWAIPAATDIAFAMGVLALLGSRAPTALKLFLVTVAIVDDMGAVAIIALFYTAKLNLLALSGAAVILGAMMLMNRNGVRTLSAYMLGFGLLWYAVLLSGVHATIAGVLAAMVVPIIKTPGRPDAEDSPLHQLEHYLSAPVAFFIVPLFGFANAGVDLSGLTADEIVSPLPMGIALGLFLGKQLGIFAAVWLAVKTGFAAKPRGSTWTQIYGISVLCGIGFTMSLFIGGLAFAMPVLIDEAKIGTLMGSLIAAIIGYMILRIAPLHRDHGREEAEQEAEIAADGDIADLGDA